MKRRAGPSGRGWMAWAGLAVVIGAGCDRRHDLGSFSDADADAGLGDSAPTPDAVDDSAASPDGSADGAGRALPVVEARHVVFDAKSGRLYATVGGAASAYSNSLVVIDVGVPVGRVASSVPVGSQPSSVAISDDGTTAWVGVDGEFSVRAVDLTTTPPTADRAFALPNGTISGDETTAGPMCVLQGAATTIAISLRHYPEAIPGLAGVAILDDGVPRQMLGPADIGASWMVRGEAGWLFGADESTNYGLYSLPVTAAGVTQMAFDGLLSTPGPAADAEIVYADGRIYATNGAVVDVTAPAAPVRVGTFGFMGAIAAVPSKKRVYMISPATDIEPPLPQAQLRLLDTETFTQVSAVSVPGLTPQDAIWDLVLTSPNQLVFIAGDRDGQGGGRLVFLPITPLP